MSERAAKIEQVIVLSVVGLLIIGSIAILFPFLRAILWAVVFAVTLWPFFLKLERKWGGRTGPAAMVPTLLLALIFFLPVMYAGSRLVAQAPVALDYAQELMKKGVGAPPSWLKSVPLVGGRLHMAWQDMEHHTPKLIQAIKPHVKKLLGSIIDAGTGMARVMLTAVLSLILFFFLLKEGHAIRDSLETMSVRLGGEKGRDLLFVAGATMRSVVYGILFSAFLQGVLSVLGLWISGVPNAFFLGTAAGLFALIPVGLIQVVLLPAAGWLIYKDQTAWGIFLFIWSIVVVGNIDNVIRPMLISRGAKVPFLVILLGVLGGLASGGIVGLFVGATLLAVCYTMLKEWVSAPEQVPETLQPAMDRAGEDGTGIESGKGVNHVE